MPDSETFQKLLKISEPDNTVEMVAEDGKDVFKIFYMLIGSVLIAISSGYGLVAGFQENFFTVYMALLVFVSGYKISQIGLHNGRESGNIFKEYFRRIRSYNKTDGISFIGGSAMMALSYVLLSQAILELSVLLAAASAVSMGAGYMVVHWAINNTLV